MVISSRTPEGSPNDCPVCGKTLYIESSFPIQDATCPHCGSLLWFPSSIIGCKLDPPTCDTVISLQSSTQQEVIREVVSELAQQELIHLQFSEEIIETILRREELGSTGIGNGVAVPHASHWSLERLVAAKATSKQDVDYNSLDVQPVHEFFVLISPEDRPGDHLRALERISRFLRR
ncbi:MAG: hypothetical protein CMJ64_24950 [Planctomycetaceae bacterium]|nr:hypothetical protein [Planctomycetaceae bacterium]